jgi:predicted dehydrogenase
MKPSVSRRDFLKQTSALTAGLAVLGGSSVRAFAEDNDRLRVAVIGCNGRGMNHISAWLQVPGVEIACICDVDSRAVAKGIEAVVKKQQTRPQGEGDLRRVLADPSIAAISIAMPDHWHTPATVLACKAGKHVYVEKPGSHNFHESQLIVAAARKYKRVVQMGNQRRSWPWVMNVMASLHAGEIGKVFTARGWYTNHRLSLGHGKIVPVPDWLDYSLWQGPAPEQPYRDNILHYNWHWFWNWGTGEMGNNGVHALDLARWGLEVELPRRVTCGGGRYNYQDDWETPDTITATFDFGDKEIIWEGQSCAPRGFEDASFGVNFYGENGCLALTDAGAKTYDVKDKLVRDIPSAQTTLFGHDADHFANFVDGIRNGTPLRAEIAEGQKSTTMCHLANLAWRTGHTINFDLQSRKILGDHQANALAERKYRHGWEPKI